MNIRNLQKKFISLALYLKFKKKVTLLGSNYYFMKGAGVNLGYGSTKDDVILDDNVDIFGKIISQGHGKIYFGKNSKLGVNACVRSVNNVVIGECTAIGDNVIITDNSSHPLSASFRLKMRYSPHGSDMRSWIHSDNAPIIIGKNVWIGENSRINKGVTIGDNAIIGANAIVTKDVPANCIAVGNPARILTKTVPE